MIVDKGKEPVVTHTDSKNEKRRLKLVIDAFAKELLREAHSQAGQGKTGWDNPSPENGLYLRKKLLGKTSDGTKRKKNLEVDIGLYSCFVWFHRLETEKRNRLLELW